jgi:hypothetical protein
LKRAHQRSSATLLGTLCWDCRRVIEKQLAISKAKPLKHRGEEETEEK